jgi:cell division protein FtsW (lipid II flippase)
MSCEHDIREQCRDTCPQAQFDRALQQRVDREIRQSDAAWHQAQNSSDYHPEAGLALIWLACLGFMAMLLYVLSCVAVLLVGADASDPNNVLWVFVPILCSIFVLSLWLRVRYKFRTGLTHFGICILLWLLLAFVIFPCRPDLYRQAMHATKWASTLGNK